jgi:ubiquinone/menaquinone biosynthesis C-methylase UbiE
VDADAVERFILRVGRPVPQVLVFGAEVGAWCREFDRLGASAFGADLCPEVLELARVRYPAGNFRVADARALPFADGSFDGVWAGRMLSRMPRAEAHRALRELHRVMRMGALLGAELLVGAGESVQPTADGPRLETRWAVDEFARLCDALDMQLIDEAVLPAGAVRLLFRREY